MELFQYFVTIIGILMSLGYYTQAYKMFRNKSSENVSVSSFIIFSIGTNTWLIYGLILKDLPIILSFGLGAIGSILVLSLTLYYKYSNA